MGIRTGGGVAAFVLAILAMPAEAETPKNIWQGCVENKGSGLVRLLVGSPTTRDQTPIVSPGEGIARCSDALNALDPAAPWQRRAALLRSRANYYVRAKNPSAAIADLDAIVKIEQPDDIYRRSFGVSTRMLRAMAHIQTGQRDAAAQEALEAMRLRPWNERVAQFAYVVYTMRDKILAEDASHWDNLVALDSSFSERRAALFVRAGDWDNAVEDWLGASPAPGEAGQIYVSVPNLEVQGAPGIKVEGVDVRRTVDAAIAAAMAGRGDLADSWLEKLRVNIQNPTPNKGLAKIFGAAVDPAAQTEELEKWGGVIHAAKVAGVGDMASAASLLDSMQTMPLSVASIAMMHTIVANTAAPANVRLKAILAKVDEHTAQVQGERLAELDPDKLLGDLPDHEEVMLANSYRSAVKFLSDNGASAKVAKDGKTAEISFFGDKSPPFVVGEMTLLRAADVTLAQKHTAFRVVSNTSYVRTSTMTRNGIPVSAPKVSGHKAVMSIEFIDPTAPGAVDAAQVRAELGPIYTRK